MRRLSAGDIMLTVPGLPPWPAAVRKGQELLTVPAANNNLWSRRPWLIFQVESEPALGIWRLSGLFTRWAWLARRLCFDLFHCVARYKSLTRAASCGCFGTIYVNP